MDAEPVFKDINATKTLLNKIVFSGKEYTEINIKKLIFRPVLKRIVFIIDGLERIILYEGDVLYEAHKNDSDETLISALLSDIDTKYKV